MARSKTTYRKGVYIFGALLVIAIGIGAYSLLAYKHPVKKTFEQLKQECIEEVKAHPEVVYKQAPCSDDLIKNKYLEQ